MPTLNNFTGKWGILPRGKKIAINGGGLYVERGHYFTTSKSKTIMKNSLRNEPTKKNHY